MHLFPVLPTAGTPSDPGIVVTRSGSTLLLLLPELIVPVLERIHPIRRRRWSPSHRRLVRRIAPTGLIPRGFVQPALQTITGAITDVPELITPPLGALEKVLADAGTRQRQIVESIQTRGDEARLLINDAVGGEAPA